MYTTLPPSPLSPIIMASAIKRKRNAFHAVSDQVVPPQHYVFPATTNNGGLGSSSGCHELVTMAETARAAPVKKDTYASLDSLPIGYRFLPTDQELVTHYLLKKMNNQQLPMNKIGVVDIYENHPEKIVENQPEAKEGQWLFFSPRTRKYTNGKRPDRKAGNGYWKATGADNGITDDDDNKIGDKKSLVYHEGRAPKGIKTNWIMHEYVLAGHQRQQSLNETHMKFDDFVLCKIYKKESRGRKEAINNNQVVNDHHQESNNSTTHGENNVEVICDSTTNEEQPANPTIIRVEQVRVTIPDREPRSLQMVSNQEPINPIIFHPNNVVIQNPLSYNYDHSSMGLQNSLSHYHPSMRRRLQPDHLSLDMRFSQLVAPSVQPPPRPVTPQVPPPPRPVAPSVQPPPRPVAPSVQPPPRPVAPSVQPPPRPVAPSVQPPPRPVAPSVQPPPRPVALSVQPPPRPVAPSVQPPPRSVAPSVQPPPRPVAPSVQPPPRPVAPSVQPPPYHPFTSEPNYTMSCYVDILDFNRPGPSYINQQPPLQVAAPPPHQTAVGGGCDGSEYIKFSELPDFTQDDLKNLDFSLDYHELDHLNSSEWKQPKVPKHENRTNPS